MATETVVVPSSAAPTAHDIVTEPGAEAATHPETTPKVETETAVPATQASLPLQSQAVQVLPDGSTSRVTTSGNLVRTQDPSARPDAKASEKLKGNFKGAVNGTLGSIQAAFGNIIRNKKMTQKGLDKMAVEDQRLGAKHGVMPVGSDLREHAVSEHTTQAATTA